MSCRGWRTSAPITVSSRAAARQTMLAEPERALAMELRACKVCGVLAAACEAATGTDRFTRNLRETEEATQHVIDAHSETMYGGTVRFRRVEPSSTTSLARRRLEEECLQRLEQHQRHRDLLCLTARPPTREGRHELRHRGADLQPKQSEAIASAHGFGGCCDANEGTDDAATRTRSWDRCSCGACNAQRSGAASGNNTLRGGRARTIQRSTSAAVTTARAARWGRPPRRVFPARTGAGTRASRATTPPRPRAPRRRRRAAAAKRGAPTARRVEWAAGRAPTARGTPSGWPRRSSRRRRRPAPATHGNRHTTTFRSRSRCEGCDHKPERTSKTIDSRRGKQCATSRLSTGRVEHRYDSPELLHHQRLDL